MKFEDEHDREAETLSDLVLTTQEGDGVKAGIGVDSAQLTIQGQIDGGASGGGHGAGKVQMQDFHFGGK